MTRPAKKEQERFWVEQTGRYLDKVWALDGERESPDFVVTEGDVQFGLEVTELFKGPQGADGSAEKIKESLTQRSANALRRAYEAIADIPLTVKFLGNMEDDSLKTVVPTFVAHDLSSKPIGYQFVHDTAVEHPSRSPLRVHVTKALRPDWFCVNDRAGFVQHDPHHLVAAAIECKARDLPRYRAAAGGDIRLLLVANRLMNSGKLLLVDGTPFDLHGFQAVYLLSYPERAIILHDVGKG